MKVTESDVASYSCVCVGVSVWAWQS